MAFPLLVEAINSELKNQDNSLQLAIENDSDIANGSHGDYGDIGISLLDLDDHYMITTTLCRVDSLTEHQQIEFNKAALRLGMIMPLVSISIVGSDEDASYVLYGQLFKDDSIDSAKDGLSHALKPFIAEINALCKGAMEITEYIEEIKSEAKEQ